MGVKLITKIRSRGWFLSVRIVHNETRLTIDVSARRRRKGWLVTRGKQSKMQLSASTFFVTAIVIVSYSIVFQKVVFRILPQFLTTPPSRWRKRVNDALIRGSSDHTKTPVLDFGWKTGSVRRNMILASFSPGAYGNKRFGSGINVGVADRKERKEFVNRMVPGMRSYKRTIFGFFHPYCNAGGGGEKVLWKAVETTLAKNPQNVIVIYTGDLDASEEEITTNVARRFGYTLDKSRIVFIYLKTRHLVDAKTWPRLTLLGQAFGSVVLALEALYRLCPDVWCDTMGYPFAYPFVHWCAHIPVVTYTHYPIISSDMLQKLRLSPKFTSSIKLLSKYCYWRVFMLLYTFCGSYVDLAMTNSSWTNNHIKQIWPKSSPHIVYPPCSTEKLVFENQVNTWSRKNQALVLAQFRPEKRHELILTSFSSFLLSISPKKLADVPKLVFIGSTRGEQDRLYVEHLKHLAFDELGIPEKLVEFITDCEYDVLKNYLRESSYGINAMWNEHFGIAVVEYVASGLIPIVHASAGPLLDIVVPWNSDKGIQENSENASNRTGFFFKDASDPDYRKDMDKKYSTLDSTFATIVDLSDTEKINISNRGKQCVLDKFSDINFDRTWNENLANIETLEIKYAEGRHDI
ncbi:LAMI_0E04368g1_1 [Lachancea mirantina]|uniref:GDP-Man:Man(3)GlcNAc(2)-PP-Dol alpha-1,2-mannosyltransferase n=1 Tax=Lachancea mirantina TaxID=1230905 RepID=A0A1G4JKL4_9SACH|nr:LAMI_0E04368g1_1 [Lachancea mirantina]